MSGIDVSGLPPPTQAVLVFQFPYPRTKKLVFQNIFRTDNVISKENLTKTSSARDELMNALDSGQTTAVFNAAEKYLPYLFGLVVSVEENKNLRLNSPLNFSWSSAFTKDPNKPHYYACYTYKYEAAMAVTVYAIACINKAFEIVNSGGNTLETFEEPSKKAAALLRTAAGVFEYLQERELPRWIDAPKERPFEVNIGVCKVMSEYCCATAQTITLKKALLGGTTSKQVMAKLAVDVWKKYEAVQTCFTQAFPAEFKDIYPIFKNFLNLALSLSKATAYKYMGEAAHAEEKYGHAVSYLSVASACLKTVWVPSPNTPLAKFRSEIEGAKDYIEHIKRTISNENNHIYFQKEVPENSLEILEAKCLMTPLGWVPPKPGIPSIQ